MCRPKPKEQGAVLLFMIAIIATLTFFLHTLLPTVSARYPDNKLRTIEELNQLHTHMQDYYFSKGNWPSTTDSLQAAVFIEHYLVTGLYGDGVNDKSEMLSDAWGMNNAKYKENSKADRHEDLILWSVGPNFTDDSYTGDDISRTMSRALVGRARTSRKLDVIQAACSYYSVTLTENGNNWAANAYRRKDAILGPAYDKDGWDKAFYIKGATQKVFSFGPDRTNNTADDITW